MSNYTVKKLLAIAAEEVGYCEKASNSQLDDKTANAGSGNYTKYARDLNQAGYYNGNKNGFDWCDVFVDWCFWVLCGRDSVKGQEIICQTGELGAGVGYSAGYYKAQGRFFAEPQAGDQIFFGKNHTGIVEKVENGRVHTIEGNAGNKVCRKSYALTDSTISGYGRPYYDEDEEDFPDAVEDEIRALVREEIAAEKRGAGTGDAHSAWANDAIAWASKNGIVSGFGGGDMGYQALITREQAIVMLYRLAKLLGKA